MAAEPSPAVQAGADAPAMLEEAGAGERIRPAIGGVLGGADLEPQVLRPVVYAPQPAGPVRVRVAELTLSSGGSYRPPTGACQDVLLLVRRGELRAVGTGIAPAAAPATLYRGDAVRFGPENDGLVQNLSDRPARTVVAFVRSRGEPSLLDGGPAEGAGCDAPPSDDPLRRSLRSTSVRTTAPVSALDGALRVHVLLDEPGVGARHGGLNVLRGEPELAMPSHRHPEATEILYVEDGSGVAHIGGREVRLRPGVALYVPAGALHDLRSDGRRPLAAIQILSPSAPLGPAGR